MKIFRTVSVDVIRECRLWFGIPDIKVLVVVTFCDSTLNTANLCPAISVVGLFYLLTVIMNFVCVVYFRRRFHQKVPVLHVCLVVMAGNCFWCILEEMFLVVRGVYNGRTCG